MQFQHYSDWSRVICFLFLMIFVFLKNSPWPVSFFLFCLFHVLSLCYLVTFQFFEWFSYSFPMKKGLVREFILVLSEASGILNLHNDVQMCGYEDVQTMWELVKRSEMELSNKNKKRKRPLWRLSAWLNRTSCSNPMDPH